MATNKKTVKKAAAAPAKAAAKAPAKKAPVKKAAAKSAAPKKAAARPAIRPASGVGPVSLDEAKALVAARPAGPARSPARASSRPFARRRAPSGAGVGSGAGAVPADVSPGAVGAERKRLDLAQRREQKQRIQDYQALMQVMKQRGVKGLAPSAAAPKPAKAPAKSATRRRAPGTRTPAAAEGGAPLQILAEGDSWFDYPAPFFGGGIIPRLEKRLGVPILNLAKAGDEVRYMLGVAERQLTAQQLRNGCPTGGAWDVLLFSGGGNDIVDNPMALWIRDFDASLPPDALLHEQRFGAALAMVQAGYEDLIALRDGLSPGTQLVFHAYDFAVPDGRGICHMGPWLKPTFDLRGFPSVAKGQAVVKAMLMRLAKMLAELAALHPGVSVINGQGTLQPVASAWHNELHPAKAGFEAFADLFHAHLKALFPGRVLN